MGSLTGLKFNSSISSNMGKGELWNTSRFQYFQEKMEYGSEVLSTQTVNMALLCHVHEGTMCSPMGVGQENISFLTTKNLCSTTHSVLKWKKYGPYSQKTWIWVFSSHQCCWPSNVTNNFNTLFFYIYTMWIIQMHKSRVVATIGWGHNKC